MPSGDNLLCAWVAGVERSELPAGDRKSIPHASPREWSYGRANLSEWTTLAARTRLVHSISPPKKKLWRRGGAEDDNGAGVRAEGGGVSCRIVNKMAGSSFGAPSRRVLVGGWFRAAEPAAGGHRRLHSPPTRIGGLFFGNSWRGFGGERARLRGQERSRGWFETCGQAGRMVGRPSHNRPAVRGARRSGDVALPSSRGFRLC
jgi:hypothetical protein